MAHSDPWDSWNVGVLFSSFKHQLWLCVGSALGHFSEPGSKLDPAERGAGAGLGVKGECSLEERLIAREV